MPARFHDQQTTRATAQSLTASEANSSESICWESTCVAAAHERIATSPSIEGSTAATPSTRSPAPEITEQSCHRPRPLPGRRWTDDTKPGFVVHIWSHFVQLAAFVAPPFYLLAKVLDLQSYRRALARDGPQRGRGSHAAPWRCWERCGRGRRRDHCGTCDRRRVYERSYAVPLVALSTVGVCCAGPLASMCARTT